MKTNHWPTLLLTLALLALAPPLLAAEAPILTIDTGGHKAKISDIFFSRDGKRLISTSGDKTIRIWDVASGETIRTLRGQIGSGPEGKIFAAALSPDNRLLAVGGYTKSDEIRLFDVQSGRLLRLLKGHSNVILGLAFSADGRRLLSGSGDKSDRIWDVASGRSLVTLTGHSERIYAVAFSPDSRRDALRLKRINIFNNQLL